MKQNQSQDKNILIRQSVGFKNLRLHLDKNGKIILNIPFFCSERQVNSFLEKHQDWIIEQQKKHTNKLIFTDGLILSVLGKSVQIHHNSTDRGSTHIQDNILFVFGDICFIHRRVHDFIKKQTAFYIDNKAR